MTLYEINESLFDRRYLDYTQNDLNSLVSIRDRLSGSILRPHTFDRIEEGDSLRKEDYIGAIDRDGRFEDLTDDNRDTEKALKRLTHLIISDYYGKDLPQPVLSSLLHYIRKEVSREDRGSTRFHVSIFALPVCAIDIFFAQYGKMKMAEAGNKEYQELYNALASLMLQSWTLPLRNDETDITPFSVERFQHHVWWEGGNAIAYRPTFEVSVCLLNAQMFNIITKVMLEATNSTTSIYGTSFWNEGICRDGFGWGHGRQVYNNGYPTDSMMSILKNLKYLKGTSYENLLKKVDWAHLTYYAKSISWANYRSYNPPMMSRHCFEVGGTKTDTNDSKSREIAGHLLAEFSSYLTAEQRMDMETMLEKGSLALPDCRGIRYFYNNDTLIAKDERSYFYYNTASKRLKGVESADFMADRRNLYTRDGSYCIFRDEDAYKKARGTWNPCEIPGVTERNLPKEEISSEVNWQGYSSIYNYAGGIASEDSAVSGFIYEKNGTREKDGAGIVHLKCSREILKVYARKSVFLNRDIIVFLGSGIEDRNTAFGHEIRTTVDNTGLSEDCRLITSGIETDIHSGTYETPICIRNNGLVYGLPEGKKEVLADDVMTDWGYLSQQNEGIENTSERVLKIQINHGYAPIDGKYLYWISRNEDIDIDNVRFKVISHSDKVHAVEFDGMLQAVFYEAAEIDTAFGRISVSKPAILLVERRDGNIVGFISDPEQVNGNTIEVTVDGKTIAVRMPETEICGRQIGFEI